MKKSFIAGIAAALVVSVVVLAGCGSRTDAPAKGPGAAAVTTVKGVDCTEGDCRLVVEAELAVVGPKKLKGCGYNLKLIHQPTAKTVFERSTSEADREDVIDYSDLNLGVLRVTQLTLDPRKPGEDVPFVETVARVFKDGHCETKEHLLIEPERADAATVAKWRDAAIAAIATGPDAGESDYVDALGHLRNIALDDPALARAALDAIRPHLDGHWGCIFNDYDDEVRQIADLRAAK
jgi:hypothetical protein